MKFDKTELGIEHARIIPDEATWLLWRNIQGGSSDSPALFDHGYANMPSAWTLWALKSGEISAKELWKEDDDRAWYGKELQGLTARAVTRKMGWDLIDAGLYVYHPDATTRMASTVDFYCTKHEDGIGIIECKNRDYFRWLDDYTETEASIKDQIQLAHQFACHPKIKWGAIAVLVGGNELKVYPYQREALEHMIDDIETEWRLMWQRVADKDEPALTGKEMPNWLKVHLEDLGKIEEPVELPSSLNSTIAAYNHAKEELKELNKVKSNAEAEILQAMQTRGAGISNVYRVGIKYSEVAESTSVRKAHVRKTITIKTNDFERTEADPEVTAATIQAGIDAQAPLD